VALAVDRDGGLHRGLVDQEREQRLHRHHRVAQAYRGARRHRDDRAVLLAREDLGRAPVGVLQHDAQQHLARVAVARPRPQRALGAQHLHVRAAPVPEAGLRQQPARALDQRRGLAFGLGRGLQAHDRLQRAHAPAVAVDRAHLVARGRRPASDAADAHPVGADLFQLHGAEVAADVGHEVGLRIAHLVDQLLRDRPARDQSAGAGSLGDHEGPVRTALGDRVADAVPCGYGAPVGEGAAAHLRAALQQVPRERAGSEQVVGIGRPAELVDQRAQHQRAVDHAPGDHDLRAAGQRGCDRKGAEVGVHAVHGRGREGRAREHVAYAGGAEFPEAPHQVVTVDHRDARREALFRRHPRELRRAAVRVHPAGVHDHAHALARDLREAGPDVYRDEVRRVAAAGIRLRQHREQAHGALGQVVAHQVVERAVTQQLGEGDGTVGQRGRGTPDADDTIVHGPGSGRNCSSAC